MTDLVSAERAAITKLAAELPKWQQKYGPGIDSGLTIVMKLAEELNDVSKAAGKDGTEIRKAVLAHLEKFLAAPQEQPYLDTVRANRYENMGEILANSFNAFDVETLTILAGDFVNWYDEVGLSGFIGSMAATVELLQKEMDALEDEGFEMPNLLMVASQRFREKFHAAWAEIAKLHILAANM